jgi:hypothetical protein
MLREAGFDLVHELDLACIADEPRTNSIMLPFASAAATPTAQLV